LILEITASVASGIGYSAIELTVVGVATFLLLESNLGLPTLPLNKTLGNLAIAPHVFSKKILSDAFDSKYLQSLLPG